MRNYPRLGRYVSLTMILIVALPTSTIAGQAPPKAGAEIHAPEMGKAALAVEDHEGELVHPRKPSGTAHDNWILMVILETTIALCILVPGSKLLEWAIWKVRFAVWRVVKRTRRYPCRAWPYYSQVTEAIHVIVPTSTLHPISVLHGAEYYLLQATAIDADIGTAEGKIICASRRTAIGTWAIGKSAEHPNLIELRLTIEGKDSLVFILHQTT